MEKKEITNLIINYFIKKGYETNLELSVDEEKNSVNVQVNVDIRKNGFADNFAFFYTYADDVVEYSAVYEPIKKISKKKYEEIKVDNVDNMGPFIDFVRCGNDNTLHLYGKITQDKFNEELLDLIVDYCNDEISMCQELEKL